jgi:hypothetical protein
VEAWTRSQIPSKRWEPPPYPAGGHGGPPYYQNLLEGQMYNRQPQALKKQDSCELMVDAENMKSTWLLEAYRSPSP